MVASDTTVTQAAEHLRRRDPVLAPLVAQYGPCAIRPHQNYYQELVESIIGQQLSVKAGAAIVARFVALFGGAFPQPETILSKSVDELRTAGLSRAKASYIRDLAQHVVDGRVRFDHLDTLSNDEVIAELTAVKGIGPWTAHMFLMFCMGRLDILAHGDLGVRSGVQKLYGLAQLPSPQEVIAIASQNHWHPYESVACWYIWRSLDNMPAA
jgi:DNA-3-methyladenine glycosylase II